MATYNIPVYLNDKEALVYLMDKEKYNNIVKETIKSEISKVRTNSEKKEI